VKPHALLSVRSRPVEHKGLAESMQSLVDTTAAAARSSSGGRAVDYAETEKAIAERTAAVERAAHAEVLRSLDVDAPRIRVRGVVCNRIGREPGTYFSMAGDIVTERTVYRPAGVRNGPIVDPIALRSGAYGRGWLPLTAQCMANDVQRGPSREAADAARQSGRFPYSRASLPAQPAAATACASSARTLTLLREPRRAHALRHLPAQWSPDRQRRRRGHRQDPGRRPHEARRVALEDRDGRAHHPPARPRPQQPMAASHAEAPRYTTRRREGGSVTGLLNARSTPARAAGKLHAATRPRTLSCPVIAAAAGASRSRRTMPSSGRRRSIAPERSCRTRPRTAPGDPRRHTRGRFPSFRAGERG
jgi:hypothetical protein